MSEKLPILETAAAPMCDGSATQRTHLLDLTREELVEWLAARGEKKFRADQILQWIYERGATTFDEMTNLSKALRERLTAEATILRGVVTRDTLADDQTRKLLITYPDGGAVETVWIPAEARNTACVSSQVGCPVGCKFCASGLDGVERNLAAGEVVEQALRIRALIREAAARPMSAPPRDDDDNSLEHDFAADDEPSSDELGAAPRLSNIVFMGMGEPLANFRSVVKAVQILNAPWGLNVGARKITISTVGLPKQIRMLADVGLQLNLALSLHAPDDELRESLIPWGERVRIRELLEACAYYFQKTGREITLEYVLLAGVNDSAADAEQLARIARKLRANINLLRYNPVPGLPFERPAADAAHQFQQRVRVAGGNAHIRRSRGRNVQAACGQLRRAERDAG